MNADRIFATAICVILAGSASSPHVSGQTTPLAERSLADVTVHRQLAAEGDSSIFASFAAKIGTVPVNDCLADSGGESPSLSSVTTADQSQDAGCCDVGFGQACCSRWTASAEFIILERTGTANQTLVTTYPGIPNPTTQYIVGTGADQFYSSDLSQGFAGGPKVGLLRHGENGYDLEVSFFQIDGWNNAGSFASGPDITPVFVAPLRST